MRGAIAAVVVVAGAAGTIVLSAGAAAAHTEWEPEDVAPGSVVDLTLFVEDEQPDAGTIKVELFFPEHLTVAGLPAVPGWTATVVDGQVGSPATGVTWDGGPNPDDVMLPITLGPLPAEPGQLQFKVIQTYDSGTVDRWIDEWPEGSPEPPSPGPVLGLVPGAAGSIPATTAPATTAASTTTTSAATAAPEDETAAEDIDDDSGISPLVWLIPAAVVVAAVGAYLYLRRRRAAEADAEGGGPEG